MNTELLAIAVAGCSRIERIQSLFKIASNLPRFDPFQFTIVVNIVKMSELITGASIELVHSFDRFWNGSAAPITRKTSTRQAALHSISISLQETHERELSAELMPLFPRLSPALDIACCLQCGLLAITDREQPTLGNVDC